MQLPGDYKKNWYNSKPKQMDAGASGEIPVGPSFHRIIFKCGRSLLD
jgi:hypothetical protein